MLTTIETKIKSVNLDVNQIKYAEDNFLNLSELIRFLINNYEPYKKWVEDNGKRG